MPATPDTDVLLDRAQRGDRDARQQLIVRHRPRLRKMVAIYLDKRLAARIDPSDVVQESLATADRKLSAYLRLRPVPFYPWLRQIAWEQLVALHRRHLQAQKRDVRRERSFDPGVSDDSAQALAERLVAGGSAPDRRLVRQELRARVRGALDRLAAQDRQVLVLRHLEELSVREAAAVMGTSEAALKVRHVRALERLRKILDNCVE